jgi:two-component system, OmpR family, response regulator BaeR
MTTSRAQLLIVEDDPKIAALLADYTGAAGWHSTCIADGLEAIDFLRTNHVDLVLLDLMLPGADGVEVCRQLRAFSHTPVIMLTARIDEIDRLLGLETGADDYVCKPFSPREVVARVRVHLRRAGFFAPAAQGLQVDRATMRILHDGAAVPLTPVEFRILAELIDHAGRVYSRQQLLDLAHEDQRDINDRTVDSHVKNIRRKLAPVADCLQSVYGVGYRFEMPL